LIVVVEDLVDEDSLEVEFEEFVVFVEFEEIVVLVEIEDEELGWAWRLEADSLGGDINTGEGSTAGAGIAGTVSLGAGLDSEVGAIITGAGDPFAGV